MRDLEYIEILNILSAFINRREYRDINNEIDWDKLYYIAKIHNVLGIVYVVIKDNNISEDIINKFKIGFLLTCDAMLKMETLSKELECIFDKGNIDYSFFKGMFLKNIYPIKELRSMGDIDVLIRTEDREKCHQMLIENGYEYCKHDSVYYVWNYKKNNLNIEVHTNLVYGELFNSYDYVSYFENCFEHTKLVGKYKYELDVEYHLLYLFVHMAKHFYQEGCGIRMIMDVAIYIKYYNNILDWNEFWKEAEKIKLSRFIKIIISLCNNWFETKTRVDIKIDSDLYNEIEKYIFTGGLFGHEDSERVGSAKLRRTYKGDDNNNIINKIASLLRWIFPSYEYMKLRSTKLKNKSILYLPFAWIDRWINAIKSKGNSNFIDLKNTIKALKSVDEENAFLKKMGL